MNSRSMPEHLKREFQTWDEWIQYIRTSGMGVPHKLYIDLSVAHTDLELNISGNLFYVTRTNSIDDNFNVKFNRQGGTSSDYFYLEQTMGFKTFFDKVYITNDAQTGAWAEVIYGSIAYEALDIIDKRSSIIQVGILDDIEEFTRVLKFIPEGATLVQASAFLNGANSANIYTVPANRTLYVTDGNLGGYSGLVGSVIALYDGTIDFLCVDTHASYNTGNNALQFQPHLGPYAAGVVLAIRSYTHAGALQNGFGCGIIRGYLI